MKRLLSLIAAGLFSISASAFSLPPPICTERCQHFDSFNGVCLYKTKCATMGHCSLQTQCEFWDKFNGECNSEKTDYVCSTYSPNQPQLNCSSRCQYWDSFNRECDYKTVCNLQLTGPSRACMQSVSCERWDDFNDVCLSESVQQICN